MAQIIDGKKISSEIKEELKEKVKEALTKDFSKGKLVGIQITNEDYSTTDEFTSYIKKYLESQKKQNIIHRISFWPESWRTPLPRYHYSTLLEEKYEFFSLF